MRELTKFLALAATAAAAGVGAYKFMVGPSLLLEGVWLWVYRKSGVHFAGHGWPDASQLADECVKLGVAGVIPQGGLNAAREWCTPAVIRAFSAKGIKVAIGLGLDGATTNYAKTTADCVNAALDVRGIHAVMLNWEGAWDQLGMRAQAASAVDMILAKHPNAAERCVDCPWWAPLTLKSGAATHPSAPTIEFGRICKQRFPQAYGANVPGSPLGQSLKMLAWSRSPTQYPALEIKSGQSWRIQGAFQSYGRSFRDTLETLLAEPTQCLWQYTEMSDECVDALRVFKALKARGLLGVNAVKQFQASAGLKIDGIVGPITEAALVNVLC